MRGRAGTDHRTCIYRARCIYVPRPKDPPATCTSRDGDLGACNLNPPRPCAPPRLVHGYRYSRGYESATRNRPPRAAAATRSGPIDRYADTRPAAGTTFTGKVFKFRHATARGAERRHGSRSPPRHRDSAPTPSTACGTIVPSARRCVAGRWIFLDCTRKRVTAETGSYSYSADS